MVGAFWVLHTYDLTIDETGGIRLMALHRFGGFRDADIHTNIRTLLSDTGTYVTLPSNRPVSLPHKPTNLRLCAAHFTQTPPPRSSHLLYLTYLRHLFFFLSQ